MTVKLEHRETADSYHGELFRKDGLRVILCRDGIQWILQRKRPRTSAGGAAWDALGYFVTREALLRVYRVKTGVHCPEIAALPERVKRGGTL